METLVCPRYFLAPPFPGLRNSPAQAAHELIKHGMSPKDPIEMQVMLSLGGFRETSFSELSWLENGSLLFFIWWFTPVYLDSRAKQELLSETTTPCIPQNSRFFNMYPWRLRASNWHQLFLCLISSIWFIDCLLLSSSENEEPIDWNPIKSE